MPRGCDELVDPPRVDRCPVGSDLDRGRATLQRPDEECPRSRAVAVFADQHINDLAVLVDRPVQVGPPAGGLCVGLIDKPSVARRMPRGASGLDELTGEGLHPPIDRHVIDLDPALAQ
jgi:hypothetical protein